MIIFIRSPALPSNRIGRRAPHGHVQSGQIRRSGPAPIQRWVIKREVGIFLSLPTVFEVMTDVTLDERGRLTLPKAVREEFGDRYHVVELHDGVKLIPIEEDPLAALRSEFAGTDSSVDELRQEARSAALDEAGR